MRGLEILLVILLFVVIIGVVAHMLTLRLGKRVKFIGGPLDRTSLTIPQVKDYYTYKDFVYRYEGSRTYSYLGKLDELGNLRYELEN